MSESESEERARERESERAREREISSTKKLMKFVYPPASDIITLEESQEEGSQPSADDTMNGDDAATAAAAAGAGAGDGAGGGGGRGGGRGGGGGGGEVPSKWVDPTTSARPAKDWRGDASRVFGVFNRIPPAARPSAPPNAAAPAAAPATAAADELSPPELPQPSSSLSAGVVLDINSRRIAPAMHDLGAGVIAHSPRHSSSRLHSSSPSPLATMSEHASI